MVQRMTSTVNGKCQKYNRMGPLTLEPTLDNIKEACKAHFNTDLDCDVLAGERGPLNTDGSQIKNFKVIHVRFVKGRPQSANIRHNSVPSRESPIRKKFVRPHESQCHQLCPPYCAAIWLGRNPYKKICTNECFGTNLCRKK